ncbi:hypothetical protein O9929_23135 [Vibrio lentus]|nr:hypothetical protein [Vibrio lentus]
MMAAFWRHFAAEKPNIFKSFGDDIINPMSTFGLMSIPHQILIKIQRRHDVYRLLCRGNRTARSLNVYHVGAVFWGTSSKVGLPGAAYVYKQKTREHPQKC